MQNDRLLYDLTRIAPKRYWNFLALRPLRHNNECFFFAYYAQWIARSSDKIKPFIANTTFPLDGEALKSFTLLKLNWQMLKLKKKKLANVSLGVINQNIPCLVEIKASDEAVFATLNQNNRPDAFYSHSRNRNELRHFKVEKKATAFIEAEQLWSKSLIERLFELLTDQPFGAFMYDNNSPSKILKNNM